MCCQPTSPSATPFHRSSRSGRPTARTSPPPSATWAPISGAAWTCLPRGTTSLAPPATAARASWHRAARRRRPRTWQASGALGAWDVWCGGIFLPFWACLAHLGPARASNALCMQVMGCSEFFSHGTSCGRVVPSLGPSWAPIRGGHPWGPQPWPLLFSSAVLMPTQPARHRSHAAQRRARPEPRRAPAAPPALRHQERHQPGLVPRGAAPPDAQQRGGAAQPPGCR